jgi:hypothetical protein
MPNDPIYRVDVAIRDLDGRPHVYVEGFRLMDAGLLPDSFSAWPIVDGDALAAFLLAREDYQRAFRPSAEAWAQGVAFALGEAG